MTWAAWGDGLGRIVTGVDDGRHTVVAIVLVGTLSSERSRTERYGFLLPPSLEPKRANQAERTRRSDAVDGILTLERPSPAAAPTDAVGPAGRPAGVVLELAALR